MERTPRLDGGALGAHGYGRGVAAADRVSVRGRHGFAMAWPDLPENLAPAIVPRSWVWPRRIGGRPGLCRGAAEVMVEAAAA